MTPVIPFVVPSEFVHLVNSGAVKQVGAVLKDTASGKIVAHMQETGALQHIAGSVLSGNPITALGQLGLDVANTALAVRADRKLTALTSMVGELHTMQILTAATSVAGIGVTVASTLVILNRLKGLSDGLKAVEQKIDGLPQAWRELDLQKTLGMVQTQLERLEEIETRKDAKPVLQKVEESLHTAFNDLHRGTMTIVAEATIDPGLLRQLLAGLALSGGAQIKALYELDEVGTAEKRARNHFEKLQSLSVQVPRDTLRLKLGGNSETAAQIAEDMSHIRLNTASQPALAQRVLQLGISGSTYLAIAREEENEPVLLLPTG